MPVSTSPGTSGVQPAVLVIFGASGDLTSRKLMPALSELCDRGLLPTAFTVVGVARTEMTEDDFRARMLHAVEGAPESWAGVTARFRYVTGDYGDPRTFTRLAEVLNEVDASLLAPAGAPGNRLFYFAAPPSTFPLLITGLGGSGLNHPGLGGSYARVVIEKPFGHDTATARELDTVVHSAFDESQVYRIDHYLGKETVQNLLALRFANSIFEPLWNRNYVDHLEITVAEDIGVGHRGGFYEEAGALRDIVQNHLMQVVALMLMEAPPSLDANAIRDEKVKVLRSVVTPDADHLDAVLVRAQYTAGLVGDEKAIAYRDEDGVSPSSTTETYVALRLAVDNWRWAGVPIFLRTGKAPAEAGHRGRDALPPRAAPRLLVQAVEAARAHSLIVRIQPDEGISLRFGAKVPGQSFAVRTTSMDFVYDHQFTEEDLDGYERLLLDAMSGDQTLFIRSDEVMEAWRIVEPLIAGFKDPDLPLRTYPAGTWGPPEADQLLGRLNLRWRTP